MEVSEFPFSVLSLINLGPTPRLPLEPSLGLIRHQILGSDPSDVPAELDLYVVGEQGNVVDSAEILMERILDVLKSEKRGGGTFSKTTACSA